MKKQEQIEKGKSFRKAINKLERDSKGRFVSDRYYHGGMLSDTIVEKRFIAKTLIIEYELCELGEWIKYITISSLLGVLLGYLLIKVL